MGKEQATGLPHGLIVDKCEATIVHTMDKFGCGAVLMEILYQQSITQVRFYIFQAQTLTFWVFWVSQRHYDVTLRSACYERMNNDEMPYANRTHSLVVMAWLCQQNNVAGLMASLNESLFGIGKRASVGKHHNSY